MLEDKIVDLNNEINILENQIASSKFCLHIAAHNKIAYYTGFPSIESLNGGKSKSEGDSKGKCRPRALPPLEEFFLVLVRLRLGLLEQDLADHFELSCARVSRTFTTWINFCVFYI